MLPGTQDIPIEVTCALDLAAELAARYELHSLLCLLDATRTAAQSRELKVAVLGRFKAGKSSFLNRLLGRDVLPVGAVPVTAVVTEIRFGERERASVLHRDGRREEIRIGQIASYAAEKENPENVKQADRITVELPELRRFRGFTFVDTPGLESALAHNSQASMDWLPNVGLALVAVSVDPPLSEHDLDLLRTLERHTPRIAILLTKADLLRSSELEEVVEFVRAQLRKNLATPPPVFPYSAKPEFAGLHASLEAALLEGRGDELAEARQAILMRKLDTLLAECSDYVTLSLRSTALAESERQEVIRQIGDERQDIEETRRSIHLSARDVAAATREDVSFRLEMHRDRVERALLDVFERQFPHWGRSLASILPAFEDWLEIALRDALAEASAAERGSLLTGFCRFRGQVFRLLQQVRDRMSDRTLRICGVPLRTTETEIEVADPGAPDIRIGRVFDRNWELLSPVLPVWAIRSLLHAHLVRTIRYAVYQNLSRLTAQWEASIREALRTVESEAERRLDDVVGTVERVLAGGNPSRVTEIRSDLERVERARQSLAVLPWIE